MVHQAIVNQEWIARKIGGIWSRIQTKIKLSSQLSPKFPQLLKIITEIYNPKESWVNSVRKHRGKFYKQQCEFDQSTLINGFEVIALVRKPIQSTLYIYETGCSPLSALFFFAVKALPVKMSICLQNSCYENVAQGTHQSSSL